MVSITLLDIAILVFFAAVIVLSARRGFSLTSCALVGHLLSLLLAIVCAGAGTPVLITRVSAAAGDSLREQLGPALPESAAALSGEITGAMLRFLEADVLRPLLFAIAYLFVLALWHYGCLYLDLPDLFPRGKRFDQLSGAGLGILKGLTMTAASLYVLSSLGILSQTQLKGSLLLGKLWSLWRGVG